MPLESAHAHGGVEHHTREHSAGVSQSILSAVPQLLNYTDDPALDAQTHNWAFQALHDITGQRLPNDSNAWRSWYQSSRVD